MSTKTPQSVTVRTGDAKSYNVIGDQQTFLLTGEQTQGRFTLIEQNNVPGTAVPPHVHTCEDEVFHVVSGQVTFQIGADTVIAEAGTTIYLPRGVAHSFQVTGSEVAKVLMSIVPAGLEEMFRDLSAIALPPDFSEVQRICAQYDVHFV